MQKRTYLFCYNMSLVIGWAAYLMGFVVNGCAINNSLLLLLGIVQCAAVAEILHAYWGWVKSPWLLTALQIFSRVFVYLLIVVIVSQKGFPHNGSLFWWGCMVVSFAWAITEIVRYSYYATLLQQRDILAITIARYSLFILLYPLGVTGEMLIGATRWQCTDWEWMDALNLITLGVFLSYSFFFPRLYGYLLKQRRSKLRNH